MCRIMRTGRILREKGMCTEFYETLAHESLLAATLDERTEKKGKMTNYRGRKTVRLSNALIYICIEGVINRRNGRTENRHSREITDRLRRFAKIIPAISSGVCVRARA